jgi:hypothetical protein
MKDSVTFQEYRGGPFGTNFLGRALPLAIVGLRRLGAA